MAASGVQKRMKVSDFQYDIGERSMLLLACILYAIIIDVKCFTHLCKQLTVNCVRCPLLVQNNVVHMCTKISKV